MQRWHAEQPLVILHQRYASGQDTGAWQHMDFYALYVVRAGRGIHVINGQRFAIRRGDVYVTPPGTVHRYCDYQGLQAEAFCFQAQLFSDEALDVLAELPGFRNLFVRGRAQSAQDYQLHLSPRQYELIDPFVQQILAEVTLADRASAILARDLLFHLLVQLARLHEQPADAAAPLAPMVGPAPTPGLAEVLQVCETRFAEDLTVPQLAALMFLSPGHFSELFVREVGLPPATYLRQLRLSHAQQLLKASTLSITEIAQRCGFGDSAQFARAFKAAFGQTPRAYRRR